MQTWVYLTLPEVKHAQEPVNQFYHHWGKKRNILSYSFLRPFVPPENSPESWDHPKHFSVLAESGTQLSPISPIYEPSTLPKDTGIYITLHSTWQRIREQKYQ